MRGQQKAARMLGRLKGGRARVDRLTPKRRKEIALSGRLDRKSSGVLPASAAVSRSGQSTPRAGMMYALESYSLPLSVVFQRAVREYPLIDIRRERKAGAPCLAGTRIPVYAVLDAVQDHGSLEGAQQSYPNLTMEQIQQAVGFARFVVECPIDEQLAAASR